jgi:acetoin utilization deacetylase AcuC-like enzyme
MMAREVALKKSLRAIERAFARLHAVLISCEAGGHHAGRELLVQ